MSSTNEERPRPCAECRHCFSACDEEYGVQHMCRAFARASYSVVGGEEVKPVSCRLVRVKTECPKFAPRTLVQRLLSLVGWPL